MKYVLIVLIFPTTWQPGTETHYTFSSYAECRDSITNMRVDRPHMKLCVEAGHDVWTYENQEPKK